jgi:hypothetical protein
MVPTNACRRRIPVAPSPNLTPAAATAGGPRHLLFYYHRCGSCGFLFSSSFDDWTDLRRHIYNDDYMTVDPDYTDTRPVSPAQLVAGLFSANKGSLRVLDYGGGKGNLGELLRTAGLSSRPMTHSSPTTHGCRRRCSIS